MSKRRRETRGRHDHVADLSPENFPALAAFFGGYFHQDLVPVHGSADRAARAFAADAGPAARQAVRQDLERLIALVRGRRPGILHQALEQLGAAWAPSSLTDV